MKEVRKPGLPERVEPAVEIPFQDFHLNGELIVPPNAAGVVLFAHGSGSSRHSPRNQQVACTLREHGLGSLLFDLLTKEEEQEDRFTGHLRFDINWLAQRLLKVTDWFHNKESALSVGYFGSSTGGAAALLASVRSEVPVRAIVSRGGRPDLASAVLPNIKAPTLLIVGGADAAVIELNRDAFAQLRCPKQLQLIPGATHLFEEPGALEQVSELAAHWFKQYF
jgi:putative phosphoribosyl transferase